jgi:hypothetical protein
LRYHRSRFFTFLFIMQKLLGKSMAVLCKVVEFFTSNPTKLRLYFSDCSTIFYEFYKIQHLHLDLEETNLRTGPRISQIGLRDKNLDCNWVPGAMAGGGSSIPARGRLGSVGKGWGSAQGITYDRFRGLDGSEGVPGRGLGGTSLRWPLRARLRRSCGEAGPKHDTGSSRGS